MEVQSVLVQIHFLIKLTPHEQPGNWNHTIQPFHFVIEFHIAPPGLLNAKRPAKRSNEKSDENHP